MAYRAIVIPVMIASPVDVVEERDIVRTIIQEWNDINSEIYKVMFAAIGWETHSPPDLAGRPQQLINTRILKDCDLLVGVFWTRIGTPTGLERSGTVEEIKEHVGAGKPAMIYFSSRAMPPQKLDYAQYSEVQVFKEWCKTKGIIEEFGEVEEFRKMFARHLHQILQKNDYFKQMLEHGANTQLRTDTDAKNSHNLPTLSEEAETLLKSAAMAKSGTITKMRVRAGFLIQAGGQSYGGELGRESAKWEAALNELIDSKLVVARGAKGQVHELTHQGWSLVGKLGNNT